MKSFVLAACENCHGCGMSWQQLAALSVAGIILGVLVYQVLRPWRP